MVMGYPEHHPKHEAPEADSPIMPTPGLGGIDSNIQKEEVPVVKSKFGIPWKAIIGFLTVFAGQLMARAFVEGVPVIPTNTSGIIGLIGGSFAAAVTIYIKQNVYTVDQAQANLDKAKEKAS
jgi:hypothetical protein